MTELTAPRPGETLVLQEPDYRYGVGPVVAVVLSNAVAVLYHDEPWWQLDADVANGTPDNHGGWVRRGLYVRASSVPGAR